MLRTITGIRLCKGHIYRSPLLLLDFPISILWRHLFFGMFMVFGRLRANETRPSKYIHMIVFGDELVASHFKYFEGLRISYLSVRNGAAGNPSPL